MEDMILNNVKLIYFTLKKLNLYYKKDEYFDVGMIGLVKGVQTYNSDSGIKLSTYLTKCIRNEILMEVRNNNVKKSIPSNIINSLDNMMTTNLTFEEALCDKVNIEKDLINKETNEVLYECIAKLKPNEQYVINHCFGLGNYKKMRNKDIAIALKITPNYVARIKIGAISKLKIYMNDYFNSSSE